MRQVTLRNRGWNEVKKLLGKKGKSTAAAAAEILESECEEDGSASEREEEALTARAVVGEEAEMDLDDDNDDDCASVASTDSFASRISNAETGGFKEAAGPTRLEIVIEDSEDER